MQNKVSVGIEEEGQDEEEFVYLTPNQLHHSNMKLQENEVKITLELLNKYKEAASTQIKRLQVEIEKLEKIVASPYIKDKERPYQLHAVLIHDGLAENGHYYSYIYDRVRKSWWQYNDHRTFQVEEEQVMREALGDTTAYKSACNLVYISPLVSKQIDGLVFPQYTADSSMRFSIPKEIVNQIEDKNRKFQVDQQTFHIEQQQVKIQQLIKNRMKILEGQERSLNGVVYLKTYSFLQYLRKTKLAGFSKWCVIN